MVKNKLVNKEGEKKFLGGECNVWAMANVLR